MTGMGRTVVAVVAALGAAALSACGGNDSDTVRFRTLSPPAAATAEYGTEDARAVAYGCGGGVEVVAVYGAMPDAVVLTLPERTALLPAEAAASGARYSDGAVTFWSKGNEAQVDPGDGSWLTCVKDEVRSVLETARVSGAEVWGAGEGLHWRLEVFADRLVLVTDGGAQRLEAAHDGEEQEVGGGGSRYIAGSGRGEVAIHVTDERCRLGRDGREFPAVVQVTLGGRTLSGCGVRFP